jgi:hypothetical protein
MLAAQFVDSYFSLALRENFTLSSNKNPISFRDYTDNVRNEQIRRILEEENLNEVGMVN